MCTAGLTALHRYKRFVSELKFLSCEGNNAVLHKRHKEMTMVELCNTYTCDCYKKCSCWHIYLVPSPRLLRHTYTEEEDQALLVRPGPECVTSLQQQI